MAPSLNLLRGSFCYGSGSLQKLLSICCLALNWVLSRVLAPSLLCARYRAGLMDFRCCWVMRGHDHNLRVFDCIKAPPYCQHFVIT